MKFIWNHSRTLSIGRPGVMSPPWTCWFPGGPLKPRAVPGSCLISLLSVLRYSYTERNNLLEQLKYTCPMCPPSSNWKQALLLARVLPLAIYDPGPSYGYWHIHTDPIISYFSPFRADTNLAYNIRSYWNFRLLAGITFILMFFLTYQLEKVLLSGK